MFSFSVNKGASGSLSDWLPAIHPPSVSSTPPPPPPHPFRDAAVRRAHARQQMFVSRSPPGFSAREGTNTRPADCFHRREAEKRSSCDRRTWCEGRVRKRRDTEEENRRARVPGFGEAPQRSPESRQESERSVAVAKCVWSWWCGLGVVRYPDCWNQRRL